MTARKPRPGSAMPSSPPQAAAPPQASGRVQRIYPERGFGFIRCTASAIDDDIGQDFFFHHSGLDDCAITELEEGAMVRYQATRVAKGRRAEHILRVP